MGIIIKNKLEFTLYKVTGERNVRIMTIFNEHGDFVYVINKDSSPTGALHTIMPSIRDKGNKTDKSEILLRKYLYSKFIGESEVIAQYAVPQHFQYYEKKLVPGLELIDINNRYASELFLFKIQEFLYNYYGTPNEKTLSDLNTAYHNLRNK